MATHIVLEYYCVTCVGDQKVSSRDPKVGRDPPFENHCARPTIAELFIRWMLGEKMQKYSRKCYQEVLQEISSYHGRRAVYILAKCLLTSFQPHHYVW